MRHELGSDVRVCAAHLTAAWRAMFTAWYPKGLMPSTTVMKSNRIEF